jgi:STE24 endopeptidase
MPLSEQLITAIILITLIGGFIIDIIADCLNLGNLSPDLPDAFKGHYDDKKYSDSQQYLETTTQFGFLTSSFDLMVFLAFWFSGGFAYLDTIVRSLGKGTVLSGLIYIGTLLLAKFIISVPFSIYSTFVIEEKYGFNKTTPKTFVTDIVKSLLLSLILGSILLGAILMFLESGGPYAWIICWGFSAIFILSVQYIVPTWIMPLFNKFEPLEEGPLKKAIFDYAGSIKFSLSNIFVMDGSKRSSKSNAFLPGLVKTNGSYCLTPL